MALWDKLSSRGRVEDRRGMAPVAMGGLGIGGVALYLLVSVLFGTEVRVEDIVGQLQQASVVEEQSANAPQFEGEDSYEVKVTGSIQPESWTHGSSEQRVVWFSKGYDTGNLTACQTFE